MPDAVLVPLAAASPAEWWRLALAGVAGSSLGAAASYAIGSGQPVGPLLQRLPLIRPAMVTAAAAWLADEGPAGVRHQPLSGLPFKVFALLAGARGVSLVPFLGCAAAARGARFLGVCAAAALLGRGLRGPVRRHPAVFLGLWLLGFAIGLRRTVRAWEQRPSPDDGPNQ
jgi:membrane protein YqaA with SNARE-associated domain